MPTSTEVVSTTTITATPTLGSIIRITSTVPTTPVANIKNQSGSECFNGPSDKYRRAPNVPANAQVYVIGRNSDTRDWFMIDGPTGRCWIRSSDLSYEFDPDSLFLIPTSITKTASVCRTGPDVGYREQTFIPQDRRIVIIGKNNLEADWLLVTPHDSTKPCWVRSTLFSNGADLSRIPLEETPDPPTSTVIAVASTKGAGGGGGGRSTPTPGGGGTTPNPPTRTSEPEPTATLCWPPGHCK